ncbi:iron-siderophore ABC transporter substrate-binding protein [Aquibacillus koreensis]|uniref:Iron-siderophore ABC transporter substrate-binding protein n=1 Tax=Aquibacillus koreensis TaxID=279446 RepID=A0A9X4AJN3_9BACI|nr:iron-siderophore ABC transporter substrate-binding protein [Aquibacillus koreensis]MCT2536048.1 iron-siderophore ABC transporter substrate-binding protein [Aquibacillus koreensis]MDC3420503.1 iron-siderophore ABC transporter substrate-binding protein [Aquibacillus koreensis]
MKKAILLLLIGLLTSFVLVACGNDEAEPETTDNNGTEDTTDNNTTEDTEGTEDTEEASSVTVTDMYGEQTFETTPERVVVLEWVYAEDVLALDIQPVGMADIEGYHAWVNIDKELSEDVADVGTRQEPNLEAVAELNPDVIITAGFRHEAIMDSLKEIAPTLAFNPYPNEGEGNQYEEMTTTFNEIAKLFGKESEAEQVLTDLDAAYESAKEEIDAANIENKSFVLSQAYSSENNPVIRLFKDNAMAIQIMQNIGLENAYESEGFQAYGFDQASVEALQNFQDAHFFYIVQEEDNIFSNQLAGNPAWENLGFVEEGRTYQLPGDTWTFGGPLSAQVFAEQIKEVLIQE